MSKLKKIPSLLLIVCTALVLLSIFFLIKSYGNKRTPQTYTITLTDSGFVPEKLDIVQGDSIVFKTTRKDAFWPASDIHPTHNIYPEFDPKRPVDPKDSWRFTFRKVGQWAYHNHLAANIKGTITVRDLTRTANNLANCGTNKPLCWQQEITKTVEQKGIDAGFALLEELYKTDPSFSTSCHTLTHLLGKKAYQLYSHKQKFSMDFHKASFCGYGFYHGVIYSLFAKSKDLKDARDFCTYVKKNGPARYNGVDFACYHGLGHALGEEIPDRKLWNDPHKVIADAAKKCTQIITDQEALRVCIEGVFTTVANSVSTKKYPLKFNESDPYWLCRTPEYNVLFKNACYSQMNFLVLKKTNYTLPAALFYAQTNAERAYQSIAINGLGINYAWQHQEEKNLQDTLNQCRLLESPELQKSCIIGYAKGLLSFGPPDKEYEKSIQFCELKGVLGGEKESCFIELGYLFQRLYPPNKVTQVCQKVEKPYVKSCLHK